MSLVLEDAAQGARAEAAALTFVVAAPAQPNPVVGVVPTLTAIDQGGGLVRVSFWNVTTGAGLLLAAALTVCILMRRRLHPASG